MSRQMRLIAAFLLAAISVFVTYKARGMWLQQTNIAHSTLFNPHFAIFLHVYHYGLVVSVLSLLWAASEIFAFTRMSRAN